VSATTTQLLSSGEFCNCVMTLYLLKVHLQMFLSIAVTQKCQILSCDTLVGNEQYGDDRSSSCYNRFTPRKYSWYPWDM